MTMYSAKSVSKWYHGWLWDCSISCDSFFAFKAYYDKKGTEFRELVMISALALFSSAFGQHHDLSKQSSF